MIPNGKNHIFSVTFCYTIPEKNRFISKSSERINHEKYCKF